MKTSANRIGRISKIFILSALLAGCGGGGGGGAPAPKGDLDSTPPRAVSFEGSEVEGRIVSFKVIFNEAVDPATVNDAHFELIETTGGAVTKRVGCAETCQQVILTPQAEIKPNVEYQIRVSAVTDLAGNPLPEPAVWTFKKEQVPPPPPPGDTTPPHIVSVVPSDGNTEVDSESAVTVVLTFDEPINAGSINKETFKLLVKETGALLSGSYDCPEPCTKATWTPDAPLLPETTYQIIVTNGVTDPAGNALADLYAGTFTTRPASLLPPPPSEATAWAKEFGNRFNQTLYAVDAVSLSQAWSVGELGLIAATSDGGAHWKLQESGTYLPLYGVDFIDSKTGFAVGGAPAGTSSSNVILKTTDGGGSWKPQTAPALPGILKTVRFIDSGHGWAAGAGGAIAATADGGATWRLQNSGTPSDLISIDFVNPSLGWAAGASRLLKTEDGGATWRTQATFPSPIQAIDFIDAAHGWAVGDAGALLSTADGGDSWAPAPVNSTAALPTLYGIQMTSARKGWAVGDKGALLSFDGTAWTVRSSGTRIPLKGVASPDGDAVWGVGYYGIVIRNAAGSTLIQNQTTTSELYGPFFVDGQTGWTIGSNARIFRTGDGGNQWTPQVVDWRRDIHWTHLSNPARLCNKNPDGSWAEDPATAFCIRTSNVHLYTTFFLTPLKGWAIGQPSLILKTEDGGVTWTEQNIDPYAEDCYDCPKAGIYLRGIEFNQNGKDGWAAGRFRTIYKTNNGGAAWTQVNPKWPFPTKDGTCTTPSQKKLDRMGGHLFGLSMNPDKPAEVWMAGGCCQPCNPEALIAHTQDGGATWDVKTSVVQDSVAGNTLIDPKALPDTGRFHTIQMMGDHGWVAGRGGGLMRTDDGGATWTAAPTGTNTTLTDLHFIDPLNGWLVGYHGTILKTNNGGLTWEPAASGTRNDLFGVFFLDLARGWIAGSGDLILQKTGG